MDSQFRQLACLGVVETVTISVQRKHCIRIQFLEDREVVSEIPGHVSYRLIVHGCRGLDVDAVGRHVDHALSLKIKHCQGSL